MPRGDKTTASVARQERDLKAFELSLNGISVRGVMEELEIKSTQTAWAAIERGKKISLKNGIDVEVRRIDIDRMFKNTLGLLVKTAEQQSCEGQIETTRGPMGTIVKTKQGIDPRIAGELSRSLNRWAEFCGLLDRAPEVNQQATVINLSAPTDGAAFADKWNSTETVNITPSESKSESTGELLLADASAQQGRPTAMQAVDAQERTQQELF
jgi:hypothetical protein